MITDLSQRSVVLSHICRKPECASQRLFLDAAGGRQVIIVRRQMTVQRLHYVSKEMCSNFLLVLGYYLVLFEEKKRQDQCSTHGNHLWTCEIRCIFYSCTNFPMSEDITPDDEVLGLGLVTTHIN